MALLKYKNLQKSQIRASGKKVLVFFATIYRDVRERVVMRQLKVHLKYTFPFSLYRFLQKHFHHTDLIFILFIHEFRCIKKLSEIEKLCWFLY